MLFKADHDLTGYIIVARRSHRQLRHCGQSIISHVISFLSDHLPSCNVEDQSMDTFVDQLESEISDVLEQHAQLNEKTCVCRPSKPSFSEDIFQLKRQSRKRERVWRKYLEKSNIEAFQTARTKSSKKRNMF